MSHFDPVEIDGLKFDKGMCLFEFDALREPEKSRFPKIGEWVKALVPMNEIPTPQMYWQGKYWPDLFIANQLDAVPRSWHGAPYFLPTNKHEWPAHLDLFMASVACHGVEFHEAFIESMCRKITGRSSNEMSAKYHRALWLPLYWEKTLREGASIRTPFWYPRAGYAGAVDAAGVGSSLQRAYDRDGGKDGTPPERTVAPDASQITLTFLLAKPRHAFSVLFVVDPSPIYRITDMDVCAGIDAEWHRWVVEARDGAPGFSVPWATEIRALGNKDIRLPLPTIANMRAEWKPTPTINDKLWSAMYDS